MPRIYLVRHGQASFGAGDYDKLSAAGVRQARLVAERLPEPDRVVTGSLARHRETAAACLAALGVDPDREVDPRWDEYDHHEIVVRHKPAYRSRVFMKLDLARTGRPGRAFQAMFDQALLRWVAATDGYAETWQAFSRRVGGALGDLADGLRRSQTALVFTSGGPISAVAAGLLLAGAPGENASAGDTAATVWLNLNRVTVNTGITKLVTGRRGTSLVSFNDHGHLDAELLTYR